MEETLIKQNKIQLALSSIMFFSPLVKKELEKERIQQEDKKFINKYIQYWNINLGLLLVIIISWTLAYFLESDSIDIIYKTSLWTLTWLVIIENSLVIKNLLGKTF